MVLLLTTPGIKGLELAADKSGNKLIVKGCNGGPPHTVKVLLEGLDKSYKPKVRRLTK
jgi:hypothetical protein